MGRQAGFSVLLSGLVSFATASTACTVPSGASMAVALEASYVVSGFIRGHTTEVVEYVGRNDEVQTGAYAIVTIEVSQVLHGNHEAPTLVFSFTSGEDFARRHHGEPVVVALSREFATDDVLWSTLPHDTRRYQVMNDTCAQYIFPLSDPTSLTGPFLVEIFNGDGDPEIEAMVFERFLSNSRRGLY